MVRATHPATAVLAVLALNGFKFGALMTTATLSRPRPRRRWTR